MNLNANSDMITLQARGSGFPDLNGVAFFDVGLTFGFSGVYDFVDTGSGQTFAQMVGASPLDFTLASSQFAEIRNINYESPSLSASVTVPEPSTIVSLGGGGVMLWIMTGRRRAALRNRRPPCSPLLITAGRRSGLRGDGCLGLEMLEMCFFIPRGESFQHSAPGWAKGCFKGGFGRES